VPRVSPLHSQVAFRSQASGVLFNIASNAEVCHGPCQDHVSFPVRVLSLSRLSASLVGEPSLKKAARITHTVLVRSSNLLPLRGNCDSSEPETSSNYLTRLRAVSHRSWPQVPLLRVSGSARPLPEEPVNPALRSRAFTPNFKGPSQPAWLNLSPVTWDHPVLIIPSSNPPFTGREAMDAKFSGGDSLEPAHEWLIR
jgi:hypothetical protein